MNEKQLKFLEVLKSNLGLIASACLKFGISRQTYYNWYNSNKEFAEECENIIELNIDIAESALYDKIQNGDLTAIIFYLKTKGRGRGYSEKQEIEIKQRNTKFELNEETILLAEKLFNSLENEN